MDATLAQILRALVDAHQEIEKLRQQNGELQAAYTDIKSQLEAKGALPAAVR